MEMPLPKIPTDNLYKFVAIIGILFILIGLSIPLITYMNLNAIAQNTEAEYKRDSIRNQMIEPQNIFFDNVDSTLFLDNEKELSRKLSKHIIDSATYWINKTKDFYSLGLKHAIRHDPLRNRLLNHEIVNNKMEYYTMPNNSILLVISLFLIIPGIYLASWGFKNWYNKLQKPMDQWYAQQIRIHTTQEPGTSDRKDGNDKLIE